MGVAEVEAPVGRAEDHVGGSAHVGGDVGAVAVADGIAEVLGSLARRSGVRVLTRALAQVIGAPPTVTPKLRAAVRARDRGRCVVPGCTHLRFIDLHHQEPRARGGRNTLTNLLSLCTRHHRLVHEGVLAIEGTPETGWVVRHAGGVLYGGAGAV